MSIALNVNLENRIVTKRDEETGELLERFRLVSEEDDKKFQRQLEGYRKAKQIEKAIANGKGLEFIQCIQEPITEILPKLELSECGYFMRLLSYMQQRKGGLLTHKTVPLTQSKIQEIFDLKDRQTRKVLARLEEVGLIKSEMMKRAKIYYVNEVYHTMTSQKRRGRTAHFIKLMKGKLGELVKFLSIDALGLLYKIIPYFHYETFRLTNTPNESDLTKVKHLSHARLSSLLGKKEETIEKYMNELSAKGVILSTKSKNSINYYVHPDVLWSSRNPNTNSAETLRNMFNAHP